MESAILSTLSGSVAVDILERTDDLVVVRLPSGRRKTVKPGQLWTPKRATPTQAATRPSTTTRPDTRPDPKRTPWRSRAYLDFVWTQRCAWCGKPGPSDPSHHGRKAMGSKASDVRAIPLCREHHEEWHRTGSLGVMTHLQTLEWCTDRALETVNDWLVSGGAS
jgi:hypothetical protein